MKYVHMGWFRIGVLGAAVALAIVACAPSAAPAGQATTIKIVSSLPRTGSAKGQTDTIVNGIKMAIADFEQALPFEVSYADWDDATAAQGAWDGPTEKANAEKAVEDKDVMAFIGPYNSGAAR